MKKFCAALILSLVVLCALPAVAQHLTDPTVEAQIDDLLEKMTLEEKIGQLNQYSGSVDITGPAPAEGGSDLERWEDLRAGRVGSMLNVIGAEATCKVQKTAVEGSRLGIPLLFAYDVIHGYRTIFPLPLAEAASWDLEAIEHSARIAATEASAAGLHWTFAPMVDIARDARWGRIMEGAGEDPYLGSLIAAARVRGFQGEDLAAIDTIAACAKHFAAYGFAEAGRDYNIVDISDQTLHNVILPPFRASVDAGVATFMNAFNEIGGTPATASVVLQRDILKGAWNFDGFMVSDWGSIGELVAHGVAEDNKQAARLALVAGSDMDMESVAYVRHLTQLTKEDPSLLAKIDDAARRILRVKFHLGLFDDPYRYCDTEREERTLLTRQHLAASRDIARKSIVLLQNKDDLLPLGKHGKIAVIGPLSADKDSPIGSWRAQGETDSAVSLLEGVRAAVGSRAEVLHATGGELGMGDRTFFHEFPISDDRSGIAEAVEVAREADVVILALGEEGFQSGEGRSQVDIGFKGIQMDLFRAVAEVNENLIVTVMSGRPLVLGEVVDAAPAVLQTWHLGSEAGHAIADVLFGDYNPSGRLPVSFPRHVGQEPLYYNAKNTGRPGPSPMVFWSHYTDMPNSPLFPFGFGLSYTKFEISNLKLSSPGISMDGALRVTVRVANTGERTGTETVQLYVRDIVGSVTRPLKELKAFERVELGPGEVREVSFTLRAEDLAFYTASRKWEAEPGEFVVFVGDDSRAPLSERFRLAR